MATELVVTPGGYRPSDMVHKIGADLRLRILTGRLQGVDAADSPVADYGSVPRDGGNPAMTPGYALPPGADTPEGSEPVTPLGRGWIAFAHWTNEDSEHVSSFRSTWTVPPEPATQSGQTIFLFMAMQDTIPMTLLPALQWGSSAAGGGEYWSVASWYIGGTTGAVFHGELVPVNVGDELTGTISLVGRQRAHCDYQCGFEGLPEANLPIFKVRDLSRCGEVLAAYGIKQCTDYPDASATGFRNIEIMKGFRRPPLAWNPVNTVTECGQHMVILSDANPGGEVDVHFRSMEAQPEPEPAVADVTTPAETEAVPLVAAAVEEAPELELATEAVAAETVSEEGEIAPLAAETIEAIPETEQEPLAEAEVEAGEAAPVIAAAVESESEPEQAPDITEPEALTEPGVDVEEDEAWPFAAEIEELPEPEEVPAMAAAEEEVQPEPSTVAATQATPELELMAAVLELAEVQPEPMVAAMEPAPTQPQVTEKSVTPATLEVNPRIDRLVEITIHNHSPAGATSSALEARVTSLEATLDAFARLIASAGPAQQNGSVDIDVASRLERLVELKRSGVLSDEEFAAVKAQVLGVRAQPNGLNAASDRVLR
jgi:hypothetical protein